MLLCMPAFGSDELVQAVPVEPPRRDRLICMIDDRFRPSLDERPVFLHRSDNTLERTEAGALSLASVVPGEPTSLECHDLWKEFRKKAQRTLSWETAEMIEEGAVDLAVMVHSEGGEPRVRGLLDHLTTHLATTGKPEAYIGKAWSAAAYLVTEIPRWVLWKGSEWRNHHRGVASNAPAQMMAPGVQLIIEGQRSRDDEAERRSWLLHSTSTERTPTLTAPEQKKYWDSMHRLEHAQLARFFERAIRVDRMKNHVGEALCDMLKDPYKIDILWTGEQLRALFKLRTIDHLSETPAGLAHAFAERTGVDLAEEEAQPLRAFFDRIHAEAA